MHIRPETEQDRDAIWRLNEEAFGGPDEAQLVDALREGGYIRASLVAEEHNRIVGHILFSRVAIRTDAAVLEALSLAPMAVLPDRQQQGVGSDLVRAGLASCRERGHRIVVVLGHPKFYEKFGFTAKLAGQLQSPFGGGDAWMALELTPEALANVVGEVEYSPPFGSFE